MKIMKYVLAIVFVCVGMIGVQVSASASGVAVALDSNEDIIVDVLTNIVIKSPSEGSHIKGEIKLTADVSGIKTNVSASVSNQIPQDEFFSLVWQASFKDSEGLIIGKSKCKIGSEECNILWDTKSAEDGLYTVTVTSFDGLNKSKPVNLIIDNTAPTIVAPADIIKEATGITTIIALKEPMVSDNSDTVLSITNNAPIVAGCLTTGDSASNNNCTGFPVGETVIIWTVEDKAGNIATATQKVTITPMLVAPLLLRIDITHPADKLSYIVGDALNISGLVVTGTYSDDTVFSDDNTTTKIENITTENITGFNSSTEAVDQVLTITVGNKTATYTVNIKAPEVVPPVISSGGGGGNSSGSYARRPAFVFSPTPPVGQVLGAEKFVFTLFLKRGSVGNEVIELQKFLNESGYDCGIVDGKFGPKTKAGVLKFQTAKGLQIDGIVGPYTRAELNK